MYFVLGRCVLRARMIVAVGISRVEQSWSSCEGGRVAVSSTSWQGSSCISFSFASVGCYKLAV
jgi:hypothetical protein